MSEKVQFYLNHPTDVALTGANNKRLIGSDHDNSGGDDLINSIRCIIKSTKLILIIMRGLPGSGKSYLASLVYLVLQFQIIHYFIF